MANNKATVIGITGHSGVGKSFISRLFKDVIESEFKKPCKILSADEIAFNMRNYNEEIKSTIKECLGEDVYDEKDISVPSKINEIIFNPANADKRLRYLISSSIMMI
jgi:dephospho-CoA kinase